MSTVPECAEDDHDWDYISDWIGDASVINGTMDIHYKRCKICDKEGDWNGHVDDDYREYEYEDLLS